MVGGGGWLLYDWCEILVGLGFCCDCVLMADYGRSDFSEWFIGGLRWLWSYSAFLWEMVSGG